MSRGFEEAVPAGAAGHSEEVRRSRVGVRARQVLAPMRVAALRIVRRPARASLVALGVALATATLVGVSSGSLIMRDRALHEQLTAVPLTQRSFRVDDFGLQFSWSPTASRSATRALALITTHAPLRTVAFRELRFQSRLVRLTAIAGTTRWLRLESGHLPRGCRPSHCEMVVVGPYGVPRELTTPGLRIVVVGRASLKTPSVLGDFARPAKSALLVSSDVRGLSSIEALRLNFRTESWVVPFKPRDIRVWNVNRLLQREALAQSHLERANLAFRLTGPDEALLTALEKGRIGTRRMLLVGGEIAALLLGFAIIAAFGLRRSLNLEWRRLEQGGARRFQLWLLISTETGAAALVGAIAGAALGTGVAAWTSARAGVGARALFSHGLLTWEMALLVLLAWVVATVVLVVAVRPPRGTRAGPVRISDVVAVAALVTAAVAASRGKATADALAGSGGTVTLLLLFPALVSLAAAIIAARALNPALRLAEHGARRGRPSTRLALLALSRAPSRTAVAVSFLVVSLGLSLLAVGYRRTLEQGVRDEAAYQIPLDYTLTEGARLVGPLDAASLDHYRSLAPGVQAHPVLRRYGDVPSLGTEFVSPVVLGLDSAAVAHVHGWRSDFGGPPPTGLARILGAERPVHLVGPALPKGTTSFTVAIRRRGAPIDLAVYIEKPSGDLVRIPLLAAGSPGAGSEEGIPRAGRVVALELSLTRAAAAAIAHREAIHSIGGPGPQGSLDLGPLIAYSGGHRLGVVTSWQGWIGRSGARRIAARGTRVGYVLNEAETALLRPKEPTDGHPLAALVSRDIARSVAPGKIATLEFGTQAVTVRIVAVADRFPGTEDGRGSFVITDESHLQTALDADAPGTGRPIEVWLSAPSHESARRVEAALSRPPLAALARVSRHGLERRLRADPLSRSVEITLGAGALIALALAVCGLWLTMLGDVSDERGELYDLEAQGATPGELRTQLRLRAAILAALGIAGGLVLGLLLSAGVVHFVQVSASGLAPVPPLRSEVGWGPAGLGLAALIVTGAALVEVTVRRAFRESTPHRSGEVE